MATTSSFGDAYTLRGEKDGTLGYSDGMSYYPLYGRLQLASDVSPVTAKTSRHTEKSTKFKIGMAQRESRERHERGETVPLDNILFKYEETRGVYKNEVAYAREEWNSRHHVRRLFLRALRGSGAMLSSIENRVYVLDSSIPRPSDKIERGYLKIDRSDSVESFFKTIGWASRCEGVMQIQDETGKKVDTFVIKDCSRHPTVGYYVVCTKSRVTNGLICHLKPIGRIKDAMRKWVPRFGDGNLGAWGRRVHTAEIFLFD